MVDQAAVEVSAARKTSARYCTFIDAMVRGFSGARRQVSRMESCPGSDQTAITGWCRASVTMGAGNRTFGIIAPAFVVAGAIPLFAPVPVAAGID